MTKDYTDFTLDDIEKDYPTDRTALPAYTLMKQIRHGDIVGCTQNNFGLWGIGVVLSQPPEKIWQPFGTLSKKEEVP